MKKKFNKILSVFLAMLIVIGILPLSTMAKSYTDYINEQLALEELLNHPVENTEDSTATIIGEVEEKRDEYTKVYKKDDGSYTAVMSVEPLHYLNDEGLWEEINNSMVLQNGLYTNTDNDFNVELPKDIDSNENLTVEKDGHSLSFSIDNIEESSAIVENNIVASDTNIPDADTAIAQTQSAVTYSEVAENTDLQYIVTPNSIKENIIVANKESVQSTYSFTFETNGLDAVKQDDGSVLFKDNANDVKFRIPRPVMTDSSLAFSYDIAVSLTENADDTVTLTYSPSTEWVNDTNRSYPITIDPAIVLEDNDENWVEDTVVGYDSAREETQTSNGYNDFIGVVANQTITNNSEEGTYIGEIYTKINTNFLKQLGDNIIVIEAQYLLSSATTNGKAYAKEIADEVNLETVTYDTKPSLSNEIIDYYTSPNEDEAEEIALAHFNITKPLNEWLNGEQNNGFAIVAGDSNFAGIFVLNGVLSYNNPSTNSTTTQTYSTAMVFDYVDLAGYNETFKYHTQNVGKAGTGYVNDFTGQLSILRDDITVDDITLGMLYNTATYNKIKALGFDDILVYGNGWLPNYMHAYVKTSNSAITYYTDTGAAIDYVISNDGNTIEQAYSDVYGEYNYMLNYYQATGTTNEYITVTRPDSCVEHFNSYGLLTSITNSSDPDKSINISYDSQMRIDYITDGLGIKYDYIYDNNTGLLYEINCKYADNTPVYLNGTTTPLDVNYYYTSGYLTKVEYSDGETVRYAYDNDGNVTSMTLENSYSTIYTYDNNGRVATVNEQSNSKETSYERLNGTQTKVTYKDGGYELYQFDSNGKHLYTVNNQSDYVYIEGSTYENLKNYTKNGKFENGLNDWNVSENFTLSIDTINNRSTSVITLPGRTDKESTLYQTIDINGKEGDVFQFGGWFKGHYTKSSTNNSFLRETFESQGETPTLNFINDRYAQIEVSYQYTEVDENGDEQTLTETIAVPFAENLEDWQFVAQDFALKGDCETITILVRYENNANSALISDISLSKNNGYIVEYNNKGQLSNMSLDSKDVLSYTYTNESGSNVITIEYCNQDDMGTTMKLICSGRMIREIYVNEQLKYQFAYKDDFNMIKSVTLKSINSIYDANPIFDYKHSHIHNTIFENGNFIVTMDDDVLYTMGMTNNNEGYYYEKSDAVGSDGKTIATSAVQDLYGRRVNDSAEFNIINDTENTCTKVDREYSYYIDDLYGNLNRVKTYKNTISPVNNTTEVVIDKDFYYEYDDKGNIIAEYKYESDNSKTLRYSYGYDNLNRLERVNDNVGEEKGTYKYVYDTSGNLSAKLIYPLTFGSLPDAPLETITNNYTNNNMSFTWINSKINSVSENGTTVTYQYSDSNIQTYSLNGYEITNTWKNEKLNKQEYKNDTTGQTIYTIEYIYDSFNTPQGFIINNSEAYLYLKNLYGDIIGIIDKSGNLVLSYEYDVWGLPTPSPNSNLSSTEPFFDVIQNNPIMYRGYYYDHIARLYYVVDKYYNPEIGMYINSDGFAPYWDNNPIAYSNYGEDELYRANTYANYLYNKNYSNIVSQDAIKNSKGFIYNQKSAEMRKYRYGFGNVGPVGCGVVATYNAAKMLGLEIEFHDILREYETNGVMMYGLSGAFPIPLARFFIQRGYDVTTTFGKEDSEFFNTKAMENTTNIMLYQHDNYYHYVAMNYVGSNDNDTNTNDNGHIYAYNTYCDGSLLDNLGMSIGMLTNGTNEYKARILFSISTNVS